MLIEYSDFNQANVLLSGQYQSEWLEIESTLRNLPLHIKESGQKGRKKNLVFDPVGTNKFIKQELEQKKWLPNVSIPNYMNALGKDVDFVKNDILLEIQFSHYAFFLNNIARSEILARSKVLLPKNSINLIIIVSKSDIFPAANSSLHYEQAIEQLNVFKGQGIFKIPIRIVGLQGKANNIGEGILSKYKSAQSRSITGKNGIKYMIKNNQIIES